MGNIIGDQSPPPTRLHPGHRRYAACGNPTFAGDYGHMPFWARFEYCANRKPDGRPSVPVTTCESQNHRLAVRLK